MRITVKPLVLLKAFKIGANIFYKKKICTDVIYVYCDIRIFLEASLAAASPNIIKYKFVKAQKLQNHNCKSYKSACHRNVVTK